MVGGDSSPNAGSSFSWRPWVLVAPSPPSGLKVPQWLPAIGDLWGALPHLPVYLLNSSTICIINSLN